MNILKKWWFWLIVIIIIILILLFAPIKACGIIGIGPTGAPSGETVNMYISYWDYFTKGCLM